MSRIQNMQDEIGHLQSVLAERNAEIARLRKEKSDLQLSAQKLSTELAELRKQAQAA